MSSGYDGASTGEMGWGNSYPSAQSGTVFYHQNYPMPVPGYGGVEYYPPAVGCGYVSAPVVLEAESPPLPGELAFPSCSFTDYKVSACWYATHGSCRFGSSCHNIHPGERVLVVDGHLDRFRSYVLSKSDFEAAQERGVIRHRHRNEYELAGRIDAVLVGEGRVHYPHLYHPIPVRAGLPKWLLEELSNTRPSGTDVSATAGKEPPNHCD